MIIFIWIKENTKECIEKCDGLFEFQILNENICFSKCPDKYPFIVNNKYCSIIDKKDNNDISYFKLVNIFIYIVTLIVIIIIILLFNEEYKYKEIDDNEFEKDIDKKISLGINDFD